MTLPKLSEGRVVLDILANNSVDAEKPLTFDKHIFRAYDIRGIVGSELTPELYYNVGRGLAAMMHEQNQSTMLLGYDARLSSESLANALSKGLTDSGINVVSVGLVPSPVLYFAFGHLDISSGVMVTGSHNPKEYNGIKMVINGTNLTDIDIEKLYFRISKQKFINGKGSFKQLNIISDYIKAITSQIQLARPLKIAIDCGNAVAGAFAGELFRSIGAEVLELYCEVDGSFPNHHPDPSIPENMSDLTKLVKAQKCDIGLAFDGDADRLGVVTLGGRIIWPDRLLIILAQAILKRKPGAVIVYDVKCTSLLETSIIKAGGKPLMSPTGHSIVKKIMREQKAEIAGEMSGHIFIKDNWSGFDDALYSAARLLDILANSSESVEAQFAAIPDSINTPEMKILVDEHSKFDLMTKIIDSWRFDEGECVYVDGLRWQHQNGWGLVRASNTSPYLILRFEADSNESMNHIKELFRAKFKALDPNLQLPF